MANLHDLWRIVIFHSGRFIGVRNVRFELLQRLRDGQSRKLGSELNSHEMAWTRSAPIAYREITCLI